MGALSARALNPLCISYNPKTNKRTVHGERNGDGAPITTVGQDRGVNEEVEGATVQATLPDESQADVSTHGFWSWGPPLFLTCKILTYMRSTICVRRLQRPWQYHRSIKRTSNSSPVLSAGVLSLNWCNPRIEFPEWRL